MQRFKVSTKDGTMYLYYPNISIAKSQWQNAIVEEYNDNSHVGYIKNIQSLSKDYMFDYKGRYVYKIYTDYGYVLCKFSLDKTDNNWYDICFYQIHNKNDKVKPVLWDISTPKKAWEKLFDNTECTFSECAVHYYGTPKISKPQELKGIKQTTSVVFIKAKCPIYILNDDIYINHNDYFSDTFKTPLEDIGKPLSYLLKKYFNHFKNKKFIYDDAWGEIVLRNTAWIKFENIIKLFKIMKPNDVALIMRDKLFEYHGFSNTEGSYLEWLRFFEEVCNKIKE